MGHLEPEEVLGHAHRAWSAGDIDALVSHFTADLEYEINAGTADGNPVQLRGREAFANFWRPRMEQISTRTTPGTLSMKGDVGRVQVGVWLRHLRTGFVLMGSYRQILSFRGGLICRIEEYHDAAKLNAFWAMIQVELAKIDQS